MHAWSESASAPPQRCPRRQIPAQAIRVAAVGSRFERGLVGGVTFGMVDRIASALGASVSVDLRWRGEQLDRLMDAAHAAMQERAVQGLRDYGWQAEVEL